MKKVYQLLLASLIAFIFIGCGGDNNYDGETGLITGQSSANSVDLSIENIYNSIILKDSNETYQRSLILLSQIKDLNRTTNTTNLKIARDSFKELVLSYKRVESIYVAGYYSDDMRDIAEFYIEQFIKGSKAQDIGGDLDEVFAGKKTIVTNALKGITALEYTLFGNAKTLEEINTKMNQNRLNSALLMTNNLVNNLKIVQDYYIADEMFLGSSDEAIGALLNVLVDNSFKLRESRIGDAAGLTVKYLDKPDNTRLEYFKSTYSLESIVEILKTHKRVMDAGLKDIAIIGNASSEANAILISIEEALNLCATYSSSLESELETSKTQELYQVIKILQNNYTALINGLNFTQDIIEADGD